MWTGRILSLSNTYKISWYPSVCMIDISLHIFLFFLSWNKPLPHFSHWLPRPITLGAIQWRSKMSSIRWDLISNNSIVTQVTAVQVTEWHEGWSEERLISEVITACYETMTETLLHTGYWRTESYSRTLTSFKKGVKQSVYMFLTILLLAGGPVMLPCLNSKRESSNEEKRKKNYFLLKALWLKCPCDLIKSCLFNQLGKVACVHFPFNAF